MNKIISFLLLLFFLSLSGCNQPSTTVATNTPQSNKKIADNPFDLEKVKQQYANVQLTVADISEQNYNNSSALAVTLNVPLNPAQDFQSFFKVSDKQGQAVKGAWILSNSGLIAYFPEVEPSSNYTVDVLKGLTAATGSQLTESVSEKIETRELKAQVSFVSKGSVLPVKLAQGLPVVTTNIDAIDVDFHRVKANQINHFLKQWADQANASQNQSNYYLQQYHSFTELAYTGRFDLKPPKNTRHTTYLDLSGIAALKQPGIYVAVMKQAGTYEDQLQTTYFVVTDLGVHARMFANKINVQVSSLSTGEAISGVNLKLLDEKEQQLATLTTDAQGQATFESPSDKAVLLLAQNDNNFSLLQLNSPALDLSEFAVEGRKYHPLEIFTYGPRDLYRPGETVKFSAILRDDDAHKMTAAPPLKAVIKRPDGQKINYFNWYPLSENNGYYQTEYTLSDTAMPGEWTLELETAGKHFHDYKFMVEAFLPERMELLLGQQPAQELWTDSFSDLKIPVSGRYLYGAPASGNRLATKVVLKPNRHPIKTLDQYFFGAEDEKPPVMFFDSEDMTLDEQGLATLTIPSRWKNVVNSPFNIKVISSLFETGGRPINRSIEYNLWPQPALIGIRSQTKLEDITSNSEVSFDLIKATAKGQLQTEGDLIATLIKERKDYYWEYSDDQGWHSQYTEKNYKVFEKRLSLAGKKQASITVPVEWGSYLLTVKDAQTGQTSTLRFDAGGGWDTQANNQSARPDRVVLELDKKYYQANDTAKVKITPPYTGNGFVVVENTDQQLWFKRVSIPAEGKVIEIPIPAEWKRHDIYISTVVFRAGDAKEKITPNRAVGLIHLPLDRQQRQLNVNIDAPKQAIRPETTLTTNIKVANSKAGQKTHVTLAAVDVGVLNITEFKTPDPFKWFFEPRRYGLDQRDIYGQIIELVDAGTTKPRFGGDADKHAGGARPDTEVKIVSLFSGLVETDANGTAKVELKIPDFNGKLRLMAIAFNDEQFGASDAEVIVSAPIIAETSLPRFLAAGDNSTLTLDLRNQSGTAQSITLDISASAPVSLLGGKRTITLADKEKQVLQLPMTGGLAFGQSVIKLHVKNAPDAKEKIDFNREWKLGVRPAYPATSTVQRKVVKQGETATFNSDLQNLLVSSANSQLNISTRPPINIKNHLEYLLEYPYGCLEQTVSSTYPWLAINQDNLREFGLEKTKIHDKPIDLNNKARYIERGISAISGMQRSSGGFGLWSNKDPEEHWLTVYAVDFLLDAKEQGANVPQEVLDKALNRLIEYVNQRGNMYDENYSEAPEHYSFAYKAYASYVLSRVNRAPLGSLRTLYQQHIKDVKASLPLAHLGLALINQGDKANGEKLLGYAIASLQYRNNFMYLGDYGSKLRDTTQVTYLLSKNNITVDVPTIPAVNPKNSAVPQLGGTGAPQTKKVQSSDLIFQLADELSGIQYLTTQERNALFRLGVLLQNQPQMSWQGELVLNTAATKLAETKTYLANFNASGIPSVLRFTSNTTTPLYLEYSIQGYPNKAPAMQMDVISVERNYYTLQGQWVNPEQMKIKSGDTLLVHLNVRSTKRLKDALLVDLVPAGFELENQDLKNSIKLEAFKIGEETIETMQNNTAAPIHVEYLDDRFVAAMNLYENQPQHAFYLIRAVTKGVYTNPPPYAEDMYRPYIRGIGREFSNVEVF
jgi:uncharacterized protein YfaS (alpha-2-macroglobulin family)